jgi:SPP1 gp7 family putative phage head morphogenesis protein
MKAVDKKTLLQLDNLAIIYQAAAKGMKVFPEDQFVNYAEIDHELESREDQTVKKVEKDLQAALDPFLRKIGSKEDLDQSDLDLPGIFEQRILEHIQSVWSFGDRSAAAELKKMEVAANSEILFFAAVSGSDTSRDGTWNDAYEWYEGYTREISKKAGDDLFHHMQPLILEHIEKGTVRTGLVAALLDDFARVGVVRADVIARTESSKAFNWGRRSRFDGSPALAGYRYSAIMDQRVTPICAGLHGRSWMGNSGEVDFYTPPNHFRCRSILVPISKYVDFTFDPPPKDFLDSMDLSSKERSRLYAMLDKFSDVTYYPKVTTKAAAATATGAAVKTKAAPAPAAAPPPAPAPGSAKDLKEFVKESEAAAIKTLQDLIDHNVKRGISPSHPALKAWDDMIKEVQAGKYKDKVFTMEWNKKSTNSILVREFTPHGNMFIHTKGRIPKKDMDQMLKELDLIKNDPLFKGLKVQLENYKSGSALASYSAGKDLMIYTKEARGIQTLYHEIGHRVHNNPALYESTYDALLRKNGINIDAGKWASWQKKAEPFWEAKRTSPGSALLPDDMYRRWDYPINAKYYYKKGTKSNYYKEMFAESSSVYLEGSAAEIKKVQRTFPGLMEFMEEVYQRGVIK